MIEFAFLCSFLNPINTGPFGGFSRTVGGLIRYPLHNFPISYAFALKLVTGVHQGLMNKLMQIKSDDVSICVSDVIKI